MNKSDTAKLIAIIVAAYPQSDKYNTAEQIEATVNIWTQMFEDDNPKLVALAVKKHVATSKWPPSIAEIRKIMAEIEHPELVPPDTAWEYVQKILSVKNFSHFTGIDVSEDEIPPLITKTVTALGGWDKMGKDKNAKDSFYYQYRPAFDRELEKAMLPKKTKELIDRAACQFGGETIAALETADKLYEQAGREDPFLKRALSHYDNNALPTGKES